MWWSGSRDTDLNAFISLPWNTNPFFMTTSWHSRNDLKVHSHERLVCQWTHKYRYSSVYLDRRNLLGLPGHVSKPFAWQVGLLDIVMLSVDLYVLVVTAYTYDTISSKSETSGVRFDSIASKSKLQFQCSHSRLCLHSLISLMSSLYNSQ